MSNAKCCVPGCLNSEECKEVLHKFPNPDKNKYLFNTWVYSVGGDILQLENDHIFKYRRVCHLHFEQKYWCRNNRLSNIAVPTQNMPGLTASKFISKGTQVLRPIQNLSEFSTLPSTSKEPMTGTFYIHSETSQIHGQNVIGTCTPLKENLVPAVALHSEAVAADFQSKLAVKTSQIKSSLENYKQNLKPILKKMTKRIAVTPMEKTLYKKLLQTGVKLSKCRSKVKSQAIKLKALKNITSNPHFLQKLEELPTTAKILTLLQFKESKKALKGRRFTVEEKILALSIFKQSPKAYRFLRKIFILPSPQTLHKLINMANIKPGINKNIMDQIKQAAEKMKYTDRLCVLLFDEMSLKPNLAYNERKDIVCGFVTNGQETQTEFADHAQVFMVRGLIKNYKQPVSYTFTQAATKGPELAKQLKRVISELQAAGLIVVATVCDQGTNNVQCIKILVDEARATLLRRNEEPKGNFFIVDNNVIIPLYDPPHLMKCIRNNLITKDLKYIKDNSTKIAKWCHITNLHQQNPGYRGIRLVPKLTDLHCVPSKIPKMKVKYVTQLFSQTVASNMGYLAEKGILPPECKETADILLFFDQLFDSVNGSFGKRKKFGKPLLGAATSNSIHNKFWEEATKTLKEMKFINNKTNINEHVPTLKNWVWTLEGIQMLVKKLKNDYGVNSVWLRHLNQDPIENFFGSIRSHGCRNTNPTPDKFESAFTTLLINRLSSAHAPGSNCETDTCFSLHQVIITSVDKEQSICHLECIPDITLTPLEEKNEPHIIGGLQYVSGYFIKSAKRNIFKGCSRCKLDLINVNNTPEYIKYRDYSKRQWLCSPSESLLSCISSLQDINYEILKSNLEKCNLKEFIKTIILMFIDFDFINCTKHKDLIIEHIIKISCRFFIHNHCKEINKILTYKRDCDDDNDVIKIKAKKYALKGCKRKLCK